MFDSFWRSVQAQRPVVQKSAASPTPSGPQARLRLCLAISAVVHLLIVLVGSLVWSLPEKPRKQLEVYLKPLDLPEPVQSPVEPATPPVPENIPPPSPVKTVLATAGNEAKPRVEQPKPEQPKPEPPKSGLAPQLRKQLAEQVLAFYPDEYVQQRIEGEVVLRLFVDSTSGKVLAVRVEVPSPHGLFNDAARQAALASISALSPGMPGEVLLPVKFRLGN